MDKDRILHRIESHAANLITHVIAHRETDKLSDILGELDELQSAVMELSAGEQVKGTSLFEMLAPAFRPVQREWDEPDEPRVRGTFSDDLHEHDPEY